MLQITKSINQPKIEAKYKKLKSDLKHPYFHPEVHPIPAADNPKETKRESVTSTIIEFRISYRLR